MTPRNVVVIGLGYVGAPLAQALAEHHNVVGIDPVVELVPGIKTCRDYTPVTAADIVILALPTPVDEDHKPDTSIIERCCRHIAPLLHAQTCVVLESTVYPGFTRTVMAPLLHRGSIIPHALVGYSPERVSPGKNGKKLSELTKVISGTTPYVEALLESLYRPICADIYRAHSIEVAEAAKLLENVQRDVNIGLMNEMAMVFDRMGISTQEVLDAAKTKWNFCDFAPGLVGGHCIGVDPYYLINRAERLGVYPKIMKSVRETNNWMPHFIAEKIRNLALESHLEKGSRIAVYGTTFKENCPDVRNSLARTLVRDLGKDFTVATYDPFEGTFAGLDEGALISVFAVAHDEFKPLKPRSKILIDIKGIFDREDFPDSVYWKL